MKIFELKRIIRECVDEQIKKSVRNCINEIFAEKFIESRILETATHQEPRIPPVSDYKKLLPEVATEINCPAPPPKPNLSARKMIVERLGLNEADPMAYVFEDTAARGNPIARGEEGTPGVTEKGMQKAGAFDKDWTKFL